jgi:hypothetical protein
MIYFNIASQGLMHRRWNNRLHFISFCYFSKSFGKADVYQRLAPSAIIFFRASELPWRNWLISRRFRQMPRFANVEFMRKGCSTQP